MELYGWVCIAMPGCWSGSVASCQLSKQALIPPFPCPCRVCQAEQRALHDLETAEQQCGGLRGELEAVRSEFQQYQAMKAVEVRLLEQRVLQQLRGGGSGSGGAVNRKQSGKSGASASLDSAPSSRQPATVADLQAACRQEGIAAALREASLERLQREQLEADLATAQEAGQQLKARAREAEQELAAHRSRHAGEARQVRERAERLAAELADSQAALKLARSEGSRRLKELQVLQRQAADENGGTNCANAAAQLEGERRAREAADSQLREARQELARKAALIRDLRAKVGG